MTETNKITIVTCGNCGYKQFWNQNSLFMNCKSCNAVMILKTISGAQIKEVKSSFKDPSLKIAYSDYRTYPLKIEEVENAKKLYKKHLENIKAKP
jgi:transcription elongation factor Elf1